MGWSAGGSGSAVAVDRFQEAAERLLPGVVDLLRRASGSEPVVQSVRVDGARARAAVRFPDGIGRGELVARLFQYRGGIRIDIWLEHDRMLAGATGVATATPCYLNDYMTSLALPADAEVLPEPFRPRVVEGVRNALTAVDRAAARSNVGWGLVGVAARPQGGEFPIRLSAAVRSPAPGARRERWVDPVEREDDAGS